MLPPTYLNDKAVENEILNCWDETTSQMASIYPDRANIRILKEKYISRCQETDL